MKELEAKIIKKLNLNPDQFLQIRAEQEKRKKTLFSTLIKLGLISEENLYIFFAQNFNTPYVRPLDYVLDEEIIELFPEEFYREHLFLPVFKVENSLYVCLANPLDAELINIIEMRVDFDICLLFSSPSLLEAAINKFFGLDDKNFYLNNLSVLSNKLNMLPFWRESQRLSINFPIEITVQDERVKLSCSSCFSALALDISFSGLALGVQANIFIPQGVKVLIKFISQTFSEIKGEIVRCNIEQEGAYYLGVKVIDIDEKFKNEILKAAKKSTNGNS